ncbi:MAG: hypothetical protein IJN88_04635 [Clostridia bacterium]|nr:hypothetical protein [Clostridia bacterium]
MKKIFIPVAIVVLILAIIAIILSKTNPTPQNYHVHEDGETHYYEEVEPTYHVHEDGVTHYDEH